MIIFRKLRWKNLLSTGNYFTEIQLDQNITTLIVGSNGSGKCLRKDTKINIEFLDDETRQKFVDFIEKKSK